MPKDKKINIRLTEKEKSIIERMKAFWLQEITIGKKKKNND